MISEREKNAFSYNQIFDLDTDPEQLNPIHDPKRESALLRRMAECLEFYGSPEGQYHRLDLER